LGSRRLFGFSAYVPINYQKGYLGLGRKDPTRPIPVSTTRKDKIRVQVNKRDCYSEVRLLQYWM